MFGISYLRHGLNPLQIHKHIRENQRMCGAPSCTGGFGARFYLPNSLKSCSAVYRNWARLRISRSSLALPALENSPDFNRARTPAIACSWFVISARSCSLVNIVRTYEVRLPEGGAAVSAACMCACLMPTTVKVVTELRGMLRDRRNSLIDEIAKDNENDQSNHRVTLLCVLYLH